MECQALQRFLKSAWWLTGDKKKSDEQQISTTFLAAHLSSCPVCQKNLEQLSKDIFAEDALTCEECCSLLPKYYEEIHPLEGDTHTPLLSTSGCIEVTIHLNTCTSCRTSYRVLAKLWDEDFL